MDVVMRDRDFRAVAFSARNAARNGLNPRLYGLEGRELSPCRTHHFAKVKIAPRATQTIIAEPGAFGESDPRGPYDAVVSNLPAKAGPALLERYFTFVRAFLLNPGGTFAFVIVTPLAEGARAWCTSAGFTVARTISTKNHMVCIARAPAKEAVAAAALPNPTAVAPRTTRNSEPASLPSQNPQVEEQWLSPYIRSHVTRRIANMSLVWDGVQGLPEFDEPSYATVCALELARKTLSGQLVRNALVVEPGVGIAPLWILSVLGSDEIVLHSHDTLALAASSHNLARSALRQRPFKVRQSLEPPFLSRDSHAENDHTIVSELGAYSIDAIFLFLEDIPRFDISSRYWPLTERCLKRGGLCIFVAESTLIDRAARQKPSGFSRVPHSERKKGWEAVAFRRD